MKLDDLDKRMRVYETTHDPSVLPGLHIVARLDGRGFTRLVRETRPFDAPFDPRFRDHMIATAAHLMDCGFRVVFGYTQSDEISLLIDRDDAAFGRRLQKLASILAGEASAVFTHAVGTPAVFDCRIAQLPAGRDVIDYFRWRHEDAARNALNAHCYWRLRAQGKTSQDATAALRGLNTAAKNELLFQGGINFNDLPAWQKRGIALCWETFERPGRDACTGEATQAIRRRLRIDEVLPAKDAFEDYVRGAVQARGRP